MQLGKILVIDDDHEMRVSLSHLLGQAGYEIATAEDGTRALMMIGEENPDIILSDVRMPGLDGISFLQRATEITKVPIVLFSAHGDIPMAVDAIQNGAYNFLEKPFDPRRLLTLLGNALRLKRLQDNSDRLEQRLSKLIDLEQILIGESAALVEVRQQILDFAGTAANVLVCGPTGTGKEIVARALHDLGRGPSAPFVAVNCAVIPAERFAETVFGSPDNPDGLMQRAHGGTLFLDELALMPVETQSQFLRVIETRRQETAEVGAMDALDVRIISATSHDPADAVASGALRQDLVFRLNTLVIDLPSLSDRGEDIALLFRHYLRRMSSLYEIEAPVLSNADYSALLSHDWPGNVRELQSVAERFVLSSKRSAGTVAQSIEGGAPLMNAPKTLRAAVAAFERQIIGQTIVETQGRMDDAADQLGIGRRTLNEKIVKLGIDKDALFKPQ